MSVELPLNLNEVLRRGLFAEEYPAVNKPGLLTTRNLYPSEGVLRPAREVLQEISIPGDWPLPPLFYANSYTILAHRTTLSLLEPSGESPLTLYDPLAPTVEALAEEGGVWRYADFHSTVVLTNGKSVVWKSRWIDPDKWFVVSHRPMRAICSWRGRLLMGGPQKEGWNTDWVGHWNKHTALLSNYSFSPDTLDENWIWWSTIGGGDFFLFWLPEIAAEALGAGDSYNEDDPYWIDLARRNESNASPAPFFGPVEALLPTHEYVLALGECGAVALSLMGDPGRNLGQRDLQLHGGIRGPLAGATNGSEAIWVDRSGDLMLIGPDGVPQNLGYRRHLEGIEEPIIHADPARREWYICGPDVTYILSPSGMGRVERATYSISRRRGDLRGLHGPLLSDEYSFTTTPMSMGYSDVKEFRGAEVAAEGFNKLRFFVEYRSKMKDDWRMTGPFFLSPEGFTPARVRGALFQLTCKAERTTPDAHISELRARYIATSRRSGRGPRTTAFGANAPTETQGD